jgi:hypothetical protein
MACETLREESIVFEKFLSLLFHYWPCGLIILLKKLGFYYTLCIIFYIIGSCRRWGDRSGMRVYNQAFSFSKRIDSYTTQVQQLHNTPSYGSGSQCLSGPNHVRKCCEVFVPVLYKYHFCFSKIKLFFKNDMACDMAKPRQPSQLTSAQLYILAHNPCYARDSSL